MRSLGPPLHGHWKTRRLVPVVLGLFCLACEPAPRSLPYDWDTTTVVTIGAIRDVASSPTGFRTVEVFAADSAGSIFVGDSDYKQVVAIDSVGSIRWRWAAPVTSTLNSMGAGYGLVAVADRTDGQVFVLNSSTGDLVKTHHFIASTTSAFASGKPLRVLSPSGAVALGVTDLVFERSARYPDLGGSSQQYLLTLDSVESRLSLPRWPGELISLPAGDGERWGYRPPLVPRFVWTPNPWGGWTGSEGYEYDIVVTGTPWEQVLRRSVGPRQPSEIARARERLEFEDLGTVYLDIRGREGRFAADTIGHFTAMVYSKDGSELWVGRTYLEPNPLYDLWSSQGEYRCSVELDMNGDDSVLRRTPPFIVNGRLYHVATSALTDRALPHEWKIKVFDVSNVCSGSSN